MHREGAGAEGARGGRAGEPEERVRAEVDRGGRAEARAAPPATSHGGRSGFLGGGADAGVGMQTTCMTELRRRGGAI